MTRRRPAPTAIPMITPVPSFFVSFVVEVDELLALEPVPVAVEPEASVAAAPTMDVIVVTPPFFRLLVIVLVLVGAAPPPVLPTIVVTATPPIWLAGVAMRDAATP